MNRPKNEKYALRDEKRGSSEKTTTDGYRRPFEFKSPRTSIRRPRAMAFNHTTHANSASYNKPADCFKRRDDGGILRRSHPVTVSEVVRKNPNSPRCPFGKTLIIHIILDACRYTSKGPYYLKPVPSSYHGHADRRCGLIKTNARRRQCALY